ncbi:MAG: GntR family transcriptional regulator, partial [bacterium]|nr:GntR family transcriptional regulator [bacterium]
MKQQIVSGSLARGTRLPPDQEVSKSLGVSIATIKEAYDELVREGYLARRPGRGTSVAVDIPALRSFSAVREIGIAFYDVFSITNTYLAKILNGISEVASETGFSLSIFTFKGRSIYQGNDLLRESLERRSISGLLLLSRMAEKDIRTLMEVGCPIVAVDNEYVNLDIPTVLT